VRNAAAAAAGSAAAGGVPAGAQRNLIDRDWLATHRISGFPPNTPRTCSFVELLIAEKADISGVADLNLGTSWLHEVVR
jgi:hypothetical protein